MFREPEIRREILSFTLGQDKRNLAFCGVVVSGQTDEDQAIQPVPGLDALIDHADDAALLLKTLGHDGRLTILCHLLSGPKSVTELEKLLSARQAIVSQQLARMRHAGMVTTRREGQAIYYSLLDPKVTQLIRVLAALYHVPDDKAR